MEPSKPAPTAPNPPRKTGGPGKFKKTIMALARTVHIYATLFAFLGLLLFSVSGFVLHHPNWFAVSHKSQIIAHLPAELVTRAEDKLERLKIVERLRADAHLTGNVRMA